ncbi:MAG: thiol:disulfide interchange protein DsbA/DsbL [Gammaproteobacteria bacterium]|nr:thiol:disulfide interchange protein DsbA/DsbL [Gammaproteobacteria bacterium]
MSKKQTYLTLFLLFLLAPLLAFAAPSETFTLDKEYKLVAHPAPRNQPGKVEVLEFFSYGCPACSAIEPAVEAWLITKPKNVDFERVPVIFHPEWYVLAKAYYVAKNLHIANRMTPLLFTAIHVNHQDLTSKNTLQLLFQTQGVSRETFEGNYDFSPSIDAQVYRAESLQRQFALFRIPTFIVDGTYETSIGMAGGDPKRMMKVIDFLIAQQQKKMAAPLPPQPTQKK